MSRPPSINFSKGPPDNLVIARNVEGNFMLAESMKDVLDYANENPGVFPIGIEAEIGRYEKDAEGRDCWRFSNFTFYMPSEDELNT